MDKKILKKQKEISEAKEERARKKVVYDTHTVILDGQRNTVRELEVRSDILLKEYIESDNKVSQLMKELSDISTELEIKNENETN